MNRFKKLIGITAVALVPVLAEAQDLHFTQFYETSILRNPALTGIFSGDYKVGVAYRSQWNSITNPYQTAQVSAETRYAMNDRINDYISFGLLAYYDKAGSAGMQTLSVNPAINYNKSLEDTYNSFLSVGFTGGFIQRSVDPGKMTFNNQYQGNRYDPAASTGENFSATVNNWDLGAGISFSSSSAEDSRHFMTYYIGVSGYHFTEPKVSFYNDETVKLGTRWNGTAGMSMKLNENYNVQFHANYAMQQGSASELIGGGLLGWNKPSYDANTESDFGIFAGLFYRLNDALVPVAKIKYKTYTFGMAYDVNVSKLRQASNLRGGFEITAFKAGIFRDPKIQKAKTICPHSFW